MVIKHLLIRIQWFFKLLFGAYYPNDILVDNNGKRIPIVLVILGAYELYTNNKNLGYFGLCCCMHKSVMNLGQFDYPSEVIEDNIKLFSNSVASIKFNAKRTDDPADYWWDIDDKVSRINYLNYLIELYRY